MLAWLSIGRLGTVPPWELPPDSLTPPLPPASRAAPVTPVGTGNATKNAEWADTPGWPAGCPKYAAWAQHEIEQLQAKLKTQLQAYAQLKNETDRLQSDASTYYRTGSTKQMAITCDCAQCQSGPPLSVDAPPAPPMAARKTPVSAFEPPKSAPEPPKGAPEPPRSAPEPPRKEASVPKHATSSECPPTPRLPPGSHCILIVAEAPDDVEMGMANRMHRMADALVSIGVRHCRHKHQLPNPRAPSCPRAHAHHAVPGHMRHMLLPN